MCRNFVRSILVSLLVVAVLAVCGNATAGNISVSTFLTGSQTALSWTGATAYSSTVASGVPAYAFDGYTSDNNADTNSLIFSDNDTDQRLAATGFTATTNTYEDVRVYSDATDSTRLITTISVYYSTSTMASSSAALNSANYTFLITATPAYPGSWTSYLPAIPKPLDRAYTDVGVTVPVGTKSLLFDFGPAGGASWDGDRVWEVQLIHAVPEPASLVLVVFGLIGLLCYAWRKRK